MKALGEVSLVVVHGSGLGMAKERFAIVNQLLEDYVLE